VHLHHWILCIPLAILISCTVRSSGGKETPSLLLAIGFLVGMAASDLVYTDAIEFFVPCPCQRSIQENEQ